MKVDIIKTNGQKAGKSVELNDDIFGIEPNDHAIYLAVKQFMANNRQGTHKSKERSETAGSTRKLHRQKGTGGSRKGDIKNPLYHGGGTIFGPKPRDYSFKLNRKVKELARKSALSYKAKENNIMVIEDFKLDAPKTKELNSILKNLGAHEKRTLVVIADADANASMAARNLAKSELMYASQLNTYDIMRAQTLILSESSVNKIHELIIHE